HQTIRSLQSKIRESEERLSRAFESAMDAIVTIDEAGRITLFNAAAEEVFRCTAAAAVGTAFARFVSADFRAMIADHLREDPGQPSGQRGARTPFRADGEEFPVEASLSRVDAARK